MAGFGAVWQEWQVSGIHPEAEGVGGDGQDENAAPEPAASPLSTHSGHSVEAAEDGFA